MMNKTEPVRTPEELQQENLELRRLLFLKHICLAKYGDDGEMQCNRCFIDFRRDSLADIGMKSLATQTKLGGNPWAQIEATKVLIKELERIHDITLLEFARALLGEGPRVDQYVYKPNQFIREIIETALKYKNAGLKTGHEVEQILGKALGYPFYMHDQKNFPGAKKGDGVCVGEHVAESIAQEAANRLGEAESFLVLCASYAKKYKLK